MRDSKELLKDAYFWWIIDYMETLALYCLSWGGFSAKELGDIIKQRPGLLERLHTTLPGMINVAQLAEELIKEGFYVHYLGYNYLLNQAQPDLLVAKNGKAAIVEVKGRLNDKDAIKKARELLKPKPEYRGKSLGHIAQESGLPLYLAYRNHEGDWRLIETGKKRYKSITLKDFIQSFD